MYGYVPGFNSISIGFMSSLPGPLPNNVLNFFSFSFSFCLVVNIVSLGISKSLTIYHRCPLWCSWYPIVFPVVSLTAVGWGIQHACHRLSCKFCSILCVAPNIFIGILPTRPLPLITMELSEE